MQEINFNVENPTEEEALILVNNMPFPEAVIGDRVRQFGFWFELTSNGWEKAPSEI